MARVRVALLGALLSLAYLPGVVADRPVVIEVKPHSFSKNATSIQPLNQMTEEKSLEVQQKARDVSKAPDLLEVFQHNQRTRNAIKSWITTESLQTSVDNYGLGPPVASLAKDTGKDPIQHDFVSQLGARLEASNQTVRYLEIGVSVLKSVHTQSNFFRNAVVTSLDIEDPNPTIEALWKSKSVADQWDVDAYRAQHKREHDYINKYKGPNNNTLYYVAGDAYSGVTYDHLHNTVVAKHGPMNLVLSDAYHTATSVSTEIDNLLSHGIIVPGQAFALLWDDCDDHWGGIYSSMTHIFQRLRFAFRGQATCSGRFFIPGWVGQNEKPHGTCIFSTMDLSGPHLQASYSWLAKDSNVTCRSGLFGWTEYMLLFCHQYWLWLLGAQATCFVLLLAYLGRLAFACKEVTQSLDSLLRLVLRLRK